jgi:hypothetical protein
VEAKTVIPTNFKFFIFQFSLRHNATRHRAKYFLFNPTNKLRPVQAGELQELEKETGGARSAGRFSMAGVNADKLNAGRAAAKSIGAKIGMPTGAESTCP